MLTLAEQDNLTRWRGQKPFYEVYYLKFNNLAEQTALWLRYTLLAPPKRAMEASLWGIYFDAKNPHNNFFVKETFPDTQTKIEREFFYFSIGDSALFQDGARGHMKQSSHTLEWDLHFTPGVSLKHYPALMYILPLPKTRFLAPHLSMKISGSLVIDGRRTLLPDVPGHQAHLWGTEQGHRWAWANCNTFQEDPDAVFEALTAQVKIGPRLSPPISLLFFWVDGQRYAFQYPHHWFRNISRYDRQSWHLEASKGNRYFIVDLRARPEDQMEVPYEDPTGSHRLCLNTKLADLRLDVLKKSAGSWELTKRLTAKRSAAFEVVETAYAL